VTRVGVLLPTFDPYRQAGPRPLVAAARLAEELGFDGVWAGDHLVCRAPVLDAPAALAAAAAVTERVTLGFSVLLLGLRPPAWAAKQLATIDALAPGRLAVGVGVGGEHPEEFVAAGVTVHDRGARLDDALRVLPGLLAGRPQRHVGRVLDVDVPALAPAVSRMPPILVGGRGEPALRRAARFGDAWLPMWLAPDALAARRERLHELAAEHGRPAPTITLLVLVRVQDDPAGAREHAAAHLRGQYDLPLDVVERWAALGPAEHVAGVLRAALAAGVDDLVLMPLGPDPLEQYERLRGVVDLLGTTPSPLSHPVHDAVPAHGPN
jgi:alkanesulfonate monooxygenase SsuD/methylene tetrahydromethanopterin reductase-like flavin-dependent oxidoreductase (luciferase family)